MKKKIFLLFLLSTLFLSSGLLAGEVTPFLQQKMLEALEYNELIPAVIVLKDQVDVTSLDMQLYAEKATPQRRAYTVITALQDKARLTQPALLDYLASRTSDEVARYEGYWIVNCIVLEALPAVLTQISTREDVAYVDYDYETVPIDPVFEGPAPEKVMDSAEPGLKLVNAHRLWELGYTGAGTIVMSRDSGVDGNHPALASRWRGTHVHYSFAWQGQPGSTFPTDYGSTGHGTHTMGTITGLEVATNDTIGVAPGAEWIASAMDYQSIFTSFQWAMNPDGNASTTDDMPCVISNSWGFLNSTGACYAGTYASLLNNVEAVGIAIVFSAGNEGPGAQTITEPKNINTNLVNSWATGSLNGASPSLPVSSFSSRGPSGCGGTGSILIKPEATAPGENVRSAVPGGGYGLKSGTSMACPHVAGAVALLKEAFPLKTGHEIKLALYYTAKETRADLLVNDPGEPTGETSGEDHHYGKGIIDVYAAYLYLLLGPAPLAPGNFVAYSDYRTPTSMQLTWTDPTQVITGDPLNPADFRVVIMRDGAKVDSVIGGTGQFVDTGLNDGQEYDYTIYAAMDTSGAYSILVETSWIAGGSPVPTAPLQLMSFGDIHQIKLKWMNPSRNVDNTPMDDFAGVHLFQDSAMVAFFPRTAADTARIDSTLFSPAVAGFYRWFITAVDNEVPLNQSAPSGLVRTPISLTFNDDFQIPGTPDPVFWYHEKSDINDDAVNPPSPPYSLNLNGTGIPIGQDLLESYPIDISDQQGNNIKFSYLYQPQGTGDAPLSTDSLKVFFKNRNANWVKIKAYGGEPLTAFRQEIFDMDSLANLYDIYFNAFQIRITVSGRSSPVLRRADWFIDNLYLGAPSPLIGVSEEQVSFDSTEINTSSQIALHVSNVGLEMLNVLNIVSDNPVFTVDTTAFDIGSGLNQEVIITFAPNQVGTHTGELSIISNSARRDTLRVILSGVCVSPTGLEDPLRLPRSYQISQNYPNPFNPSTVIHYQLPRGGEVSLEIYNVLGQRVKALVQGWRAAGRYEVEWRGDNDAGELLSSGIYIYRFMAGDYRRTLKMMLMK